PSRSTRLRDRTLNPPGAVLLDDLAVQEDLAARAQVLDDVPMDLALVRPADVREAVAEGEMDRPVDLLVEERVLHELRDAGVATDAELAEAARALVLIEELEEERLFGLGGRVDDLAALEPEADPGHLAPEIRGRELDERDRPFGRVLNRRVVELSAGHVGVAGVDRGRPALEAEREVRLGADDPHLVGRVEALRITAHALPLGVPVEQAGPEEEVLVVPERHARILGMRRRRVVAADPLEISREDAFDVRPDRGLDPPEPLGGDGRRLAG